MRELGELMFLGLDLGTGSLKALLMDAAGRVLHEASASYTVTAPHPGWAESDPEDWWRAAETATRAAVGPHAHEIRAIGLSGQMHSLVLCDAAGRVARNAILWADTRCGSQLEGYRNLAPALRQRLGNPTVTGMTGPSLLWVRQHEPAVYDAAVWALQPKDWLRLRLTGETLTDPSDASATLLYDLTRDTWDAEVISVLGLRMDCLPHIQPSHSVGGRLTRVAAEALGLRAGIPVAAGAADTAAAMLGSGLLRPGAVQLTVGSGAQIVAPCSALSVDPEFRTHLFRSCLPVLSWYRMAAMQNAGLALEAVRTMLGLGWEEAYSLAFGVAGSDGLTFLPHLMGERSPHNNPNLSGAWVGLRLHHGRAHLMRAAFEGVAFAIRDGLKALQAVGVQANELRLAGGGTTDPRWRQLLSDTLNCRLQAVELPSASARGAALLGALAVGEINWADLERQETPTTLVAEPQVNEELDAAYLRFKTVFNKLSA